MKKEYITFLCDFLPIDSCYFRRNGVGADRPSRLALALNDPKFGWNFLKALREDGLRLPLGVFDRQLLQADAYLASGSDDEMVEALLIFHPRNARAASLLKALLICRDVTLENIAIWMNLPFEVVMICNELLFNVRDRLDEPAYIAQLLNPDGFRFTTDTSNEDLRLLRAGATHGAREVIRLTRIGATGSSQSSKDLYSEFENETMETAITCLRHGGAADCARPVVATAKTLLVAQKRMQQDQPSASSVIDPLEDISNYHPVQEWLMKMQAPAFEAMLQSNMGDASEPAKPAKSE